MQKKLITILLVISSLQMSAKTLHEFSIFGGGGWSSHRFYPSMKEVSSTGFSADIGGGFTGFFNQNVGFHLGGSLVWYNVKSTFDSLQSITLSAGKEYLPYPPYETTYWYDLHTTFYNYKETHKMFCLTIPLMLHFQSGQYQSWNRRADIGKIFYAMTGFKVNVIVKNTHEMTMTKVKNLGYFPDTENWVGTQRFAGFGTANCKNSGSGSLDFDVMAMLALEAGMKWRIDDAVYLYTGIYFDYGLNDPAKDARKSMEDYDTYTKMRSTFGDIDIKDVPPLSVSDRVNLMTVGVKLRIAFIRNSSPYDCPRGF